MPPRKSEIELEKDIIRKMTVLYCHGKHGSRDGPCQSCSELLDYAFLRLDRCKFGDDKPTCQKCPIHCYKPDMRQRVKEVMRYAGPRMFFHHPLDAVRHLIKEKTKSGGNRP